MALHRLYWRAAGYASSAPAFSWPNRALTENPPLSIMSRPLSAVPVIIDRGAAWFAGIGNREKSKCIAPCLPLPAKLSPAGWSRCPWGRRYPPLSLILMAVFCGKKVRRCKQAVLSGGCIPARFIDTPVEYENLAWLGSIMGSGGMVVMDESTCMVEIARYFVSFTQSSPAANAFPAAWAIGQNAEILDQESPPGGKTR